MPNETGAVEEIHVLTTDQVAPKNTVRNIESALIAQLGLRVNHRKISVATTIDTPRPEAPPVTPPAGLTAMAGGAAPSAPQAAVPPMPQAVAPEPAPQPTPLPGGRLHAHLSAVSAPESSASTVSTVGASRRLLVFEDVEVRRSRARGVLCRVTLTRDGEEYFGEAEGQESERSRIELSARATLQAISTATKATPGGDKSLALEGAKLIDAFDREFVFVSLSAKVGREPVVLTGSCEVRESAETSAVLAVLDATNRWVHFDR
ncbi:MAG: hypothetical protein K2R93_13730 [Gemmatimonadaceae bacterium]|nr:hypothetical protein [Gemmatimonadaceae bacterium]